MPILLANRASESTDTSATILSGTRNVPNTAIFSTASPDSGPAQSSSPSKSVQSSGSPSISNLFSTSLSSTKQASPSASKPHSNAVATSSRATSSSASAFSPTQAHGTSSLSQAYGISSVLTNANNNGNGTTITSPPAGFTTFTASNPLWNSDTTTVINGTIFPVWYLGNHEGIVLEGLGGKPDDPMRPGCSGLFRSLIGCGTWIKLPGFPTFKISANGVPIPQDPGNDGNPNDPGDQDNSAEVTSHAHEKTTLKSKHHTPSTTTPPRTKTSASARSSRSHSSPHTVASTKSPTNQLSSQTTAYRSTASHSSLASATAATTNYIIRLQPTISATELEDMVDDVKAHASNMYSISLGSRPNDTVICAKLNGSSSALFNKDPLVSSCIRLRPSRTLRKCNNLYPSLGILRTSRPESHS